MFCPFYRRLKFDVNGERIGHPISMVRSYIFYIFLPSQIVYFSNIHYIRLNHYLSYLITKEYICGVSTGNQNKNLDLIHKTWPRGFKKLFPCSTQLHTKFILLLNFKMATIFGIFTFISMINTTSERLEARNFFICRYFSFY